jgi:transposase
MPWKEIRIVDQRLQFLSSYQKEEMSVADLCREYGISRPKGYRWINRYEEIGPEGLVDRSRRPHTCSHATLEPIENAILVLRARHPSWGARKLKARLEDATARRGVACGQYVRQHLEPCGLDQSAEEKKTYHAML